MRPAASPITSCAVATSGGRASTNASLVALALIITIATTAAAVQAQVAVDDAYAARSGDLLHVEAPGVLENDHDGGGEPPPPPTAVAVLDSSVSFGTLLLNADGSFDYTSEVGFVGTDSFTYHYEDGAATSNTATVTLTVDGCEAGAVAGQWVCWVEGAYLAKAAELGLSTFVESFEEDAVWGAVREPATAPSVVSRGITWTSNFSFNDVSTGPGPARSGAWGFFSDPHGDQSGAPGDRTYDGFVGTATTPGALLGAGGWIVASQVGSSIDFTVSDAGGTTTPVAFPNTNLGYGHQFFGFIDTAGFSSFEIVETNGAVNQPFFIFGDDFSFVTSGTDSTPPRVVEIGSWQETADGVISEGEVVDVDITELMVRFSETVQDPAGDSEPDDATNPANYVLFSDGGDGFQTVDCAGGVAASDTAIAVEVWQYVSGDPSETWLGVNAGAPLPAGSYRLLVCGTTSIVDWAGNPLDGDGNGTGGDDFARNFSIPVNNPPSADDQLVTTAEDTALGITLTGSDPDGDPITFQVLTLPGHGSLGGSAPNLTYTPAADYFGPDSFTFRTFDGSLYSTAAMASITVTPVNDAPTADAQSVITPEDTAVAITLTGNDVDGDPLTFVIGSGPTHGGLTGTPPNVTYTPDANSNGPDSFTFTTTDGMLTSAPATVSITVTSFNDVPIAFDDGATTDEDVALGIDVLVNDQLGDPPTTITSVTQGTSGTVSIDAGALAVTYTPDADFNGSDSFTYTITDADLETSTATVSMTIDPVNDPPTADDQSVTTPEDTAVAITLTGGDVDGDPLTFVIGSGPTHGGLTGTPPDVTYTPATGYFGPDSFTFTVFDGTVTSAPATVSITVTQVVVSELTIGDASITEGDAGSAMVDVTVTLTPASASPASVDWTTGGGTATPGVDYTAAAGTVDFIPGATIATVSLEILGDLTDEPDETVEVTLSNPVGATLGSPSTATVTIFDNDPMAELSAADVTVGEAAGVADVLLSLDGPSGFDVTVNAATTDGTATSPSDYGAVNQLATIPAGSTSATVSVPIVDDNVVEPDETFTVDLSAPNNAVLMTPSVTVTIVDDDGCDIPGDADLNCVLDANDVALLITIIDDPSVIVPGEPDCDGSGAVGASDLVCVVGGMVAQ